MNGHDEDEEEGNILQMDACHTRIIMTSADDAQKVAFYVLEKTTIAGRDYLLVTDEESGDGDAFILEDKSEETDVDALYEFVQDAEKLNVLSMIFSRMLDDGTRLL